MSDDVFQLIAAAVVTLTQLYMLEPWKYPIFAWFWDELAKFTGELANILAAISLKARLNYYHSIMETS
jgi:hypothetical protein